MKTVKLKNILVFLDGMEIVTTPQKKAYDEMEIVTPHTFMFPRGCYSPKIHFYDGM